MALSEYDKQFAEAMAVKLKLSRQQTSKTSATSAASSEPSVQTDGLAAMRGPIVAAVLADHPTLTEAKLVKQMEEMGF
jgi:hypothetical protein